MRDISELVQTSLDPLTLTFSRIISNANDISKFIQWNPNAVPTQALTQMMQNIEMTAQGDEERASRSPRTPVPPGLSPSELTSASLSSAAEQDGDGGTQLCRSEIEPPSASEEEESDPKKAKLDKVQFYSNVCCAYRPVLRYGPEIRSR